MTKRGSIDIQLLVVTILLLVFGGIMVFSSSYYFAIANNKEPIYFFTRFLKYTAVSVVICFLATFFNFKYYKKTSFFIALIGLALLVAVLLVRDEANNVGRWIPIMGFTLQPSEVAKLTGTIFLAAYLSRFKGLLDFKHIIIPIIFIGVTCALIARADYSISLVVGAILMSVLFVGGLKYRHLFIFGLIFIILAGAFLLSSPWRMDRVMALINQETEGVGHQPTNSRVAIGSGGLTGVGLNRSTQNKLHLPVPMNDYIAATIGEELGFIGMALFTIVYAYFVFRLGYITFHAPNRFSTLLGTGITTMMGMQFVLNVLINLNVLPSTGIPIPLISYGGSSMLVSMASIGIMLNISRHICLEEK